MLRVEGKGFLVVVEGRLEVGLFFQDATERIKDLIVLLVVAQDSFKNLLRCLFQLKKHIQFAGEVYVKFRVMSEARKGIIVLGFDESEAAIIFCLYGGIILSAPRQ